MKLGALILGLIGGIILIPAAFLGASIGAIGGSGGMQVLSWLFPMAIVVGATVVFSKPGLGTLLMGIPAIIMLFVLVSSNAMNGFTFFFVGFPLVSSIMAFMAWREQSNES